MIISGATPSAIAGLVWTNASRTLTSMSIAGVAVVHSSLANGVSVDLRSPIGKFAELTFECEATANVTWNSALYDGTTFRVGGGAASGAGLHVYTNGTNNFGPALNNSGTVSGNYNVAGVQWLV